MNTNTIFFVGSYAEKKQPGILGINVKKQANGKMEIEQKISVAGISNPSYLTISSDGRFAYAVMEDMTYENEEGGGIAALEIDQDDVKILNTRGTMGTLPCHILLDKQEKYVFTANYMGGSISMFPLNEDGRIGEMCDFHQLTGSGPNKERQEKSHMHFLGLSSDEKGIWAVDLGDDKVKYYELDRKNAKLISREELDISMPAGVGPRHFVQNMQNRDIMYIICELSSEIYVVECGRKEHHFLQCISTLPENTEGSTCAAIHMSEDGHFLYASNRGDDSIAVYRIKDDYTLELLEIVKTGGKTPRDFCVTESMIICANQDSDLITIMYRDSCTGKLTKMESTYSCKSPVCLVKKNY